VQGDEGALKIFLGMQSGQRLFTAGSKAMGIDTGSERKAA
jgi:hypothetical protein